MIRPKFNLILFLLIALPFFIFSQVKKLPSPQIADDIFKILSGEYARCEVKLGYASGSGKIVFGNPSHLKYTSNNDFFFLIYVLGRQDIQYGKMYNLEIESKNFNDYLFKIKWKNNRTDQGTISAEIQLFYSITKDKYETYFINNSNSVFQIFWWTELDNNQKLNIRSLIESLFKKEIENNKLRLEKEKKVEDSIRLILEEQRLIDKKRQDEFNKRNDSINLRKKKYSDSMQYVLKKENEKFIKNLKIGWYYLGGYIVYKSDDSLHGLLVSKKEFELNYKDLIYNSTDNRNKEVLFYTENYTKLKISGSQFSEFLNESILQQKLFPENLGYKLPTLSQIIKIREAYKNNMEIENIFNTTGNRNNFFPWIYVDNKKWYFINTLSSNSGFNFGIKNKMLFTNYLEKEFTDQKSKSIIRLVREF